MARNLFLALEVNPDDLKGKSGLILTPDSGLDADVEAYCQRQELLMDFCLGKISGDDYLDCLLQQGISPDNFLESLDPLLDDLEL